MHRAYLRQLVDLRLDPRLRARVDPSDIAQEAQLETVRRRKAQLVGRLATLETKPEPKK